MPLITAGYDYERHQFDNALPLEAELRWRAGPDEYVGKLVDLAGITSARIAIRREQDKVLVQDTAATVMGDAALGRLGAHLEPAVTALPGSYAVEWRVIWPDGSDIRWPAESSGGFDSLLVKRSLMGTVTPIAITTPSGDLGATTSAVLIVPDNDTAQTVTSNGQSVFAGGAGTSIAVDPAVEVFTIAALDGETPWSTGVTPTLTLTGQTLGPQVMAALAASDGDDVTLYRNGTVWYTTTPTAGTGGAAVEEVGEGNTLPGDGSVWELFRLEGNAVLPDGLYRWSDTAGVWIQE